MILSTLRRMLLLSRPRFWLYLQGPYLIGLAASGFHVTFATGVWWALYWTFPANALIYLVNDAFDQDTDQFNDKKRGYESRIQPNERKNLLHAIVLLQLPWAFTLFTLPVLLQGLMGAFWVLGMGYSVPPLRFKARPFLDSASNVLYALPGFFAFFLAATGNQPFPWLLVLASAAWCAAMHAVSAIPDIDADTRARISTIATVCGAKRTLQLCGFLYLASGVLGAVATHGLVQKVILFLPLAYIFALVGMAREKYAFAWYKKFPLLNALAGCALFWAILFTASP